jgi:hypothetical protein
MFVPIWLLIGLLLIAFGGGVTIAGILVMLHEGAREAAGQDPRDRAL